jgi:hypothetical protein
VAKTPAGQDLPSALDTDLRFICVVKSDQIAAAVLPAQIQPHAEHCPSWIDEDGWLPEVGAEEIVCRQTSTAFAQSELSSTALCKIKVSACDDP